LLIYYSEEDQNFRLKSGNIWKASFVGKSEGTYLVWLDCRQFGLNGKELNKFMVFEAGLAMSSGTYFGKNGEGFMRMNVACPRAILEKALV